MRSERAEVPEPVVSPLAIRPGVAAAIQRVDVTVGFLRAPVEFLAAVLLLLGFIRVRIFALFWSRRGVRIIALIGLRLGLRGAATLAIRIVLFPVLSILLTVRQLVIRTIALR